VAEELDLGGKGLFFIYGTENFPIQKISSNCWENLSKSATELTFHKIVGLNNKIAFGIYQDDNENPEKDSPTENQSNNKFSKSQIAQYFYSNNIKSITLKEDGNLIVQYNGHEEK
jgi:hypothetical protein